MKFRCAYCGKAGDKAAGEVNRARRAGLNLYCNRRCSGLGRGGGKTEAQKKEVKRLYDIAYRAKNYERIRARKREHFNRTYDPVAAAIERKKRMPRHAEYCRQPKYKAWKKEYDRRYRAKEFGPFAAAYLLVNELNREIKERMTNEQIKQANGTNNKALYRRRKGKSERSRPRNRPRRPSHSPAHGGQSQGDDVGDAHRPPA